MTEHLAKTPLYRWHVDHGARMVDFAGWSMPVHYGSIVDEHVATRTAAGLFDISHMGRLRFEAESARLLDRLLTRRVVGLEAGKIRYGLMTDESGGILDDVLVYHLQDASGASFHILVINASNREKIIAWIERHADSSFRFTDTTFDTAMIAVQGPRAIEAVRPFVAADVGQLSYYCGAVTTICGHEGIASRTGYTGEDGCELIVPATAAEEVWQQVSAAGAEHGTCAAGLGARDTLRLEAAMPLYGHELSEQVNPYQAGLGFAVQLKNHDFVGREAIARFKEDPDQTKRVGLELFGKRVPREHYPVVVDGVVVGEVTSGTFSPTLERPIAMAYVRPDVAGVGNQVTVEIRGRLEAARIVDLPFYRRSST